MFSPLSFIKTFKKTKTKLRKKFNLMREESVKENNTDGSYAAEREALQEMLIFLVFLISITIVANASQHLYLFFFNQSLKRSFMDRHLETDLGTELTFNDMVTTADWWLFMDKIFLTNLYNLEHDWQNENVEATKSKRKRSAQEGVENDAYERDPVRNNDTAKPYVSSHTFSTDNILLRPPRLRQIRVKKNSCDVHDVFQTYFVDCYASYTKSEENKENFYKDSKFYTMSQLQVRPVNGKLATYYGAGFVVNFSYDLEENRKTLAKLKQNKWIDRGTRLVILEFVLFNINANILDNVKIVAEVPPVGGIVPSHQFQVLKLHNLWTEGDWFLYIAGGSFYILVIFYTFEKIMQLKTIGPNIYFSSMWNLLDISVLGMSYFSLVYNLLHPWYMSEIIKKTKTGLNEFVSIDLMCYWNLLYIDMMAVSVFLVWIKIFKYISYNRTMYQFSTTLRRCAKDLFGFAVMFFIVFLAYAQLGLIIFGANHPDFREFGISVISLMRMFLGDFEYRLVEEANHVLGPIYFLTYIIFVFFILLNMFLAIINDTYGVVKSEKHGSRSNFGAYFKRLFQKSYSWCSVKKQPQSETNEGFFLRQIDEPSNLGYTNDGSTPAASSRRVSKRTSEVLREFFEELTDDQTDSPKDTQDYERLTKRLGILEEVLEELVIHMDRILASVEKKSKKSN